MDGLVEPARAGLRRRALLTALAAAGCGRVRAAEAAVSGPAEPPAGRVLLCRVAPDRRAALRRQLLDGTRRQLQGLQASGALAAFRLLFAREPAAAGGWDALLLLDAADAVPTTGVDLAPLLALGSVEWVPVVPQRRLGAPAVRAPGPVQVIAYQARVPDDAFLAYVDGYQFPQFEGWRLEGQLDGAVLVASRRPAGSGWSHLVLLDYPGEAALAARPDTVARVRGRLQAQPAWRAYGEAKSRYRDERGGTVADDISQEPTPP